MMVSHAVSCQGTEIALAVPAIYFGIGAVEFFNTHPYMAMEE